MANNPVNIYKLIVLHMLGKVRTPLTRDILFEFTIDHGYTNYFTMLNVLGDLVQGDFIKENPTYHRTWYMLTDTGRETLESFGNQLAYEIRQEIHHFLKEKKNVILEENSLTSDYGRTREGTYLTSCTLREGTHTLFRLDLDTATEADAIRVCENWEKKGEELYRQAMIQLLDSSNQK